MEFQHYKIQNLSDFEEHTHKLEKYINDIEKIFTVIEEVFGSEWKFDKIIINLKNSGNCSYGRRGNDHMVNININDKAIQEKNFPENLWGCLFHETLHGFMNPIIHKEEGKTNELNGGIKKEVFILSFQRLAYLNLKESGVLNKTLLDSFLKQLEKEVGEGKELYDNYENLFQELSYFAKFIKLLGSSREPLIRKDTFYNDLEKIKKIISNQNLIPKRIQDS